MFLVSGMTAKVERHIMSYGALKSITFASAAGKKKSNIVPLHETEMVLASAHVSHPPYHSLAEVPWLQRWQIDPDLASSLVHHTTCKHQPSSI